MKRGFSYIRFGQIVIDEVSKRGLEINENNERLVREELREKHGMAAMAKLNIPNIKRLIKNENVIIDGLYSFAEYKLLKKKFGESMVVVAVYAPPKVRYKRLEERKTDRSIKIKDAISRDYAEIEKLDKGGPIALADFTIINTQTLKELRSQTYEIIRQLGV